MSRIAGGLVLLAAIATFSAICYFQDDADDGGDTGVMPTLPDIAFDLRDALPGATEVAVAFGIQEEGYIKGGTWGFIGELASGRDGVDEQLAAGLVGAYWTTYGRQLGPEPEPGEPWGMIVSIAMYQDETSAENALLLGPDMFRSTLSFVACVEAGAFARAEVADAWSAGCDSTRIGAALIRHQQFVLTIVSWYGHVGGYLPELVSASESLLVGIDFTSIPSD